MNSESRRIVENKGVSGVDFMGKQSLNVHTLQGNKNERMEPKMIYNILTDDRKEIVSKLEELSGRKATYTRVPRCAYVLDGIVVEKDGTVTTEAEANNSFLNQLIRAGLIDGELLEEPIEQEESPEENLQEETREDERPENCRETVKPNISFPLSKHRPESLCNLVYTIFSRAKLMSKATGGDFRVSEKLVEELQRFGTFTRNEQVLEIIQRVGSDELHGLTFEDEKVIFVGFPETFDPATIKAWTELSAAINRNAIKQTRVFAKEVTDDNEKFSFRTWLTRLGMNGPELKQERNILYRNLSGHTAFRTIKDEEKWKARQAAKRQELRARKAEMENGAED